MPEINIIYLFIFIFSIQEGLGGTKIIIEKNMYYRSWLHAYNEADS